MILKNEEYELTDMQKLWLKAYYKLEEIRKEEEKIIVHMMQNMIPPTVEQTMPDGSSYKWGCNESRS